MSGAAPRRDHGLVGRVESRAFLDRTLADDARVAVVLGPPGAGKTALLAAVAEDHRAQGRRVVEVTGRALEEDLAFAALIELLSSMTDATTRRADELALLTADPLRQRLEVLHRLEEVPDGLLVLVDDAQWVDGSSLAVLSFVANRIAGTAVSMLVGARGELAPAGFAGHPVAPLPLLDPLQSRLVVRRTDPDLDDAMATAVVRAAGGNPLALVELTRSAASGQITRADPLVPLPERLERAFADELPELPAPTRELLVLAAAGVDDLALLSAAALRAGGRAVDLLAALAPAERSGLLKVGSGRLLWRHPLARAATYAAATADERRRAHLTLATLSSHAPDRRAWHLARAAVDPDEEVAAELEAAALGTQGWGGFLEASLAMQRAAELSPAPESRSRRLSKTAELAAKAGQFTRLEELGRQVHDLTDDPVVRARVDHAIAYALGHTTRQRSARVALLQVMERSWHLDAAASWSTLTSLAALALRTGDGYDAVRQWQHRLESSDQPVPWPASEATEAARALVRAVADGPAGRTPELVEQVRRPPTLGPGDPPDLVSATEMLLGTVAWMLDEHAVAELRLGRAAELMRAADAPGQLPQILVALGQVQFEAGHWDAAEETAVLLADLAESRGMEFMVHAAAELRARVAAVRGDAERAREIVRSTEAAVDPGEFASLTCDLIRTKALAALVGGDQALAYAHLRGLFREDGTPLHWRLSLLGLADLSSAAARTGHAHEVASLIERAAARVGEHPGPRITAVLARAAANLAGAEAGPSYEIAAAEDAATWPFERATAQLEYGGWLRRHRHPTLAREQLHAALATFERLGASPWAELARAELRAAGVSTSAPAARSWSTLTSQERQVVRLAATGLSNREIGEALFLSPRTVGTHLYNAFPKLGVTTRGRLRDVVED